MSPKQKAVIENKENAIFCEFDIQIIQARKTDVKILVKEDLQDRRRGYASGSQDEDERQTLESIRTSSGN